MTRRPAGAIAAALALGALALYVATLTPSVGLVDSGELTVAAHSLGVAHPPGFPSYVLLAHLATWLPLGSVAWRVNLASAVFAAAAVATIVLALAQALATAPRRREAEERSSRRPGRAAERGRLAVPTTSGAGNGGWIPLVVAGLVLAGSRTLWAYATVAEVYTLNALVVLTVLALALRWRRQRIERPAAPPDDRSLWAAALLFGFGLGVHVVTVGVLLPALAAWTWSADRRVFAPRRMLVVAGLAFAGLSVYAYLPLAAARDPAMNWGDPDTWERFLRHVTGRQYWVSFSLSGEQLAREFGVFGRFVAREFGPPWLPLVPLLALLGAFEAWRRDRGFAVGLALLVLADVAYSVSYEIAEDKDAYYLPTFIAMALLAGHGAAAWLRSPFGAIVGRGSAGLTRAVASGALIAIACVPLAANLRYDDRRRDTIARDYVEDAVSTMARGGLFLTGDWQIYSPLLYAREVEGLRPDLVAIDVRLLRRSWYYLYLRSRWPAFVDRHRVGVDAFLEDLRAWEDDPAGFEKDSARLRRIDERFFGMILAMIRGHRTAAPVYVSQEVAFRRQGEDAPLSQALLSSWALVPHGLVLEVLDPGSPLPDDVPLPPTGERLLRARASIEEDDVVRIKVLPAYAGMQFLSGRYLAGRGRHRQAIAAYERALELRPGFEPMILALEESRRALAGTRPAP